MRKLLLLCLALLLCAAACEELNEGRHLLDRGGQMSHSGSDGVRSDLQAEKMSDAALGTHAAILTAANKGQIARAANLGFEMAAGAANPSTSHGAMHNMGSRRLLDRGGQMSHSGSDGVRSDLQAEKMSDAALGTHAAILSATNKGKIPSAATAGYQMAAAATNPSTTHGQMHSLDGNRRMLSNRDRTGVDAMDTMHAASAAINKAVKTPGLGNAKYATAAGTKLGRVASGAHSGYDTDAASVPVRRLTGDGNSYRKDAGSLDTALATSNVITKAVNVPSRGSAKFATHVGVGEATVASGARQHSGSDTDLVAEEHPVRHLLQGGGRGGAQPMRTDAGALDTALATSNAITKALNAPSMGSAKFATHVGSAEAKVAGTNQHKPLDTDLAAEEHPVRRLAEAEQHYGDGVGSLDTALATGAAINKAVTGPTKLNAKYATHIGVQEATLASGGKTHKGWETDMAAEEHVGARHLLDRPEMNRMDLMNAASSAVSKAVTTPNLGGAKYATAVGVRTGQVGGRQHTGFDTDAAAGGGA